jgi:acetyltransferase-like isoleucine patch superfamily enzyme
LTVIILGCGGFSREIEGLIFRNLIKRREPYDCYFAEDKDGKSATNCVLNVTEACKKRKIVYVMAVGSPYLKQKWAKEIWTENEEHWKKFPLIKAGTCTILNEQSVWSGEGCILCDGTILTADIKLGEFVTLNLGVSVGHDSKIGNFSTLAPGCRISGNVKIGKLCELGTGVIVNPKVELPARGIIGSGSVVVKTPEFPDVLRRGVLQGINKQLNSWSEVDSYMMCGSPARVVRVNQIRVDGL